MGSDRIGECLDRLSTALIQLDHEAVSQCGEELEQLRPHVARDALSGASIALLLFRLQHASALTRTAERLYDGWRQIATPEGCAYLPDGRSPKELKSSQLKVEG